MVTVYDLQEERSVMNMLEACGDYIKQLVLPDHAPPLSV